MANISDARQQPPGAPGTNTGRRGFLTVAVALVVGAIATLVPLAAGLAVFFDPLRRKNRSSGFTRVTPLDALPDDGIPRRFPVVAEQVDAWNWTRQPIGAVYLRRTSGQSEPECLTATCPHAGCFVNYDSASNTYKCPCHNSCFQVDGQVIEPSPSPRAMDSLTCKIEGEQVLVKFEMFYCGKADKVVKG